MGATTILPNDPLKKKAWSARVASDSITKQYFARMEGEEGTASAVIRKTDLEAGKGSNGAGDEVITALVAKLVGQPITEGKKLAGNEMRLSHTSHTMRVNEFRHGVNVGAAITQSRVGYNLKKQGRERLTDYISEMYEEVITMAANGARGVGEEIAHFPVGTVGYPNAFRAPDAKHYVVGGLGDKIKSTLTVNDKMTLKSINLLRTKAKKMLGGTAQGKAVRIQQVSKGGKNMFLLAVCPEVMEDIRNDTGAQGWFEAQRALTTAIGKESELFKGGAGMFNGVLVDEMERCVKFNDFGAGNVPAARSLFLGSNAIVVAHGTKGMTDGMTVALSEDTDDRGHEAVLDFELIFGADKTQFNGVDYGMVTVDTAFTASI